MENQSLLIIDAIESSQVAPATQAQLKAMFLPFWEQAQEWKAKADELKVTDESQVLEMAQAREARLALRKIRIEAEKLRKEMKEESLRYGQAIQLCYNLVANTITPLEAHLERQENFAKYQERERQEALKSERLAELSDAAQHIAIQTQDTLGQLSQEMWEGIKLRALALDAAFQEQQAQAAAEEQARREEAERLRQENERLRQEARAQAEAEAASRKAAAEQAEALRRAQAEAQAAEQRAQEAEARALREASQQATIEVTKQDIATIERLHDALVDGFDVPSNLQYLVAARQLTARMYEAIKAAEERSL